MTTKIMLAQKHGDTAQPLYPATDTQAVLTEGTDGATLRERLLELENTSFPDFSDILSRVDTLEKNASLPLTLSETLKLEKDVMFVCPSDGILILSVWGSTQYCQARLYGADETILHSLGVNRVAGEKDTLSLFLRKGSKVCVIYATGDEYLAEFLPLTTQNEVA